MKDLKFDFEKGVIVKNSEPLLISDTEVLVQSIKIEAVTVEGDLWHNIEWGWSLIDFLHRSIDEMLRIELYQRIRDKLSKRPYVDVRSIQVTLEEYMDGMRVGVSFYIEEQEIRFQISLDRIKSEVMMLG